MIRYTQLRSILNMEIISTLGKKRKQLTEYQKQVLLKRLEANTFMKPGEKHQLAESLDMSVKGIATWFYNTRYNRKKKEILCKYMSNLQ